jgi:hypothetical protein
MSQHVRRLARQQQEPAKVVIQSALQQPNAQRVMRESGV